MFADFARHLHNRTLIASCVIGSSMLFSMVGAMTYISFRMAAPPFSFGPKALGAIFISYLFGAFGPWLSTVGLRHIGARGTLAASTVALLAANTSALAWAGPMGVVGARSPSFTTVMSNATILPLASNTLPCACNSKMRSTRL